VNDDGVDPVGVLDPTAIVLIRARAAAYTLSRLSRLSLSAGSSCAPISATLSAGSALEGTPSVAPT
jgi:hypothetical protein